MKNKDNIDKILDFLDFNAYPYRKDFKGYFWAGFGYVVCLLILGTAMPFFMFLNVLLQQGDIVYYQKTEDLNNNGLQNGICIIYKKYSIGWIIETEPKFTVLQNNKKYFIYFGENIKFL